MSSKKSKSKSRTKPTKNTEETENVVSTEKIDSTEEVVKSECLISEEENKTPNEPISIVENDPLCDVPKKPKRSKGKRKKEIMVEDAVKDIDQIREITQSDAEIKENLEYQPITASVRKKKKKGKKQEEEIKDNKEASESFTTQSTDKEKENIEKSLIDEEISRIKEETSTQSLQKEELMQKKKKKKKHRHDSEKSDKSDPCIVAFQKLLLSSNDQINVSVDNNDVDVTVKGENESGEVPDIDAMVTNKSETKLNTESDTENKNTKRRNKKGKKQPIEPRLCADTNLETVITEQLVQNISAEEVIFSDNTQRETSIKEKSPKPKAIIVKPVQKKRKTKVDLDIKDGLNVLQDNPEISNDKENLIIQSEDQGMEMLCTDKENIKSNIEGDAKDITIMSPATDDYKPAPESSNNLCETVINVPMTAIDDQSNLGPTQIEIDKSQNNKNNISLITPNKMEEKDILSSKEAKSETNIQKSEITHSEEAELFYDTPQTDIVESGIKSEECDMKTIATPDLIEYPRSTSQQLVDDNNNTLIHEITISEEVKLNIPINIPIPIIQGSGESPEINIKNEPILTSCAVNVTEIVSSPKTTDIVSQPNQSSKEKTDIKSKMLEVNRDMEELRLSIERSLAELTAVDKNDSEVEKEFEELFQSQTVQTSGPNIESSVSECTIELEKKTDIIQSKESKANEGQNKKFKSQSPTSCNKDFSETKGLLTIETSDLKVLDKGAEILDGMNTKNMDTKKPEKLNETNKKEPIFLETSKTSVENNEDDIQKSSTDTKNIVPICPARRDKGKSKSKKKGKKDVSITTSSTPASSTSQSAASTGNNSDQKDNKSEKSAQKSESPQAKSKQKSSISSNDAESNLVENLDVSFEPIEKFEDALTSSADDVNKTFEIIANEATDLKESIKYHNNPQINIIAPTEDSEREKKRKNEENKQKQSPISQPKNLLNHPNIPASSNKTDYKKEKNKPPNSIQAKVKIKDSVEIEKPSNLSKESHGDNRKKIIKECDGIDVYSYVANANEDLVYKYSFRKVFLQSLCHVCKKNLVQRVPCKFCSLVFYCSQKHKDDDWPQHQSLCFAVSTIAHLKDQKHIYSDAQNITGYDYRVLRMQMILSCEKILKRKLVPWEQEALLYPRLCADVKCREWRQAKLKDCEGCGQISYCVEHPQHLPPTHQRWCKSYVLYQKLVNYQRTKGRLEPRLPTKVLDRYQIPGKLNEVLGSLYEEKIDMDDIQYAALTQTATVPLTVAYSHQLFSGKMNSSYANGRSKKSTFTIHSVGAELTLEVDTLNKWEIFFLHLRSDIKDLRVVMIGPNLNPSNLPLDLLAKIKLCDNCQTNKRRVLFEFHDKETYEEYYSGDDFVTPDIVCAFNPSVHRSSIYNTDTWPTSINCILKQRIPFVLTSYTQEELRRDLGKIRECSRVDFNVVSEIKYNPFSSMRPDRNFITDDEMPLLFKNYCFSILCGTF